MSIPTLAGAIRITSLRRAALPTDRWKVGRNSDKKWFAGPRGIGVYAAPHLGRRWIFFASQAIALDYARRRLAGQPHEAAFLAAQNTRTPGATK